MADRGPPHRPSRFTTNTTSPSTFGSSLIRRIQSLAPTSTYLIGFLTLVITSTILLLLTGITVTATLLGLIFFTPLIIISSPIWVPIAAVMFFVVAGILLFCGFWMLVIGGLSWMYRYFIGMHPVGSDRVDYARSRIYDTASYVKDYAREYGGHLQSKVKDVAPGA